MAVLRFPTGRPLDVRPTPQAHLFQDTVPPVFRCPLGCGRAGLQSEQAVAGHLGHCKKRKRTEARAGVRKCRAVVELLPRRKR